MGCRVYSGKYGIEMDSPLFCVPIVGYGSVHYILISVNVLILMSIHTISYKMQRELLLNCSHHLSAGTEAALNNSLKSAPGNQLQRTLPYIYVPPTESYN